MGVKGKAEGSKTLSQPSLPVWPLTCVHFVYWSVPYDFIILIEINEELPKRELGLPRDWAEP